MLVHVIGPNLPDQSRGSFHVHAKDCLDVWRNRDYRGPDFKTDRETTVEATTVAELVEYVYADQIGEGSMTVNDGIGDLYVFPCANALD